MKILLGHQHGEAEPGLEFGDRIDHQFDDDRRKADRWLVDKKDLRLRHQRAGEGHHLLLAAAHAAGSLVSPFSETRKEIIAGLKVATDVRARLATQRAEVEILLDGELRQRVPPFRDEDHPERNNLLGRKSH